MKSESERGPIGAWLVRERERLNLSAIQVAEQAGIPEASYRAIEAGRWTPRGERLAALEAAIGSPSPDTTKEPPPDWARALVEDVPAIRGGVERVVTELETLRVALAAIQSGLLLPGDDQVDDPPPQRQGRRRGQ